MNIIVPIEKDKTPVLFGTVKIIYTPNIFEDHLKNEEIISLHGRRLKEYIKDYKEPTDDEGYIVYVNNIEIENLDIIIETGDIIHVFPYIGKDLGAALGSIVIAIASYYTGGLASSAYGGLAGAFASAATTIVGGMILNSIYPPESPQIAMQRNVNESKSYSLGGIATSRSGFGIIPVLYGTFHLGGTEINKRIYYENGDDWMELQIALCHGLIDAITEDDIFINGQSWKNIANQGKTIDAHWGYTDGAFDQPITPRFGDRHFLNADVQKKLIHNEDYIFETSSNLIDNFEIHITSSAKGIFHSTKQGALQSKAVTLEISYRKKGDVTWIPVQEKENLYVTEYEYELIPVFNDNGEGDDGISSGGISSGGGTTSVSSESDTEGGFGFA